MKYPPYPAARATAVRIFPHYSKRLSADNQTGLLPDPDTIEAIINVAFWASLRREETWTPRISLSFVEPSHAEAALVFERPVPFASQSLTRLGPAVERPGVHLCVWRQNGDLSVWGATRDLPRFCFVLEVVAPGLLVIKHSRGDGSGKFVNIAVLQGDEIKIIDQSASTSLPGLQPLRGLQPGVDLPDAVNVLIKLAISLRAHGRGGSLLVVHEGNLLWRQSIVQPVTYGVAPPFRALVDLMQEDPGGRSGRRWQERLRLIVDVVAGLTAVDGATIITDRYELLAFGAKIVRRFTHEQVSRVTVTEPIEGTVAEVAEPGQLGGTRHFSAAQFAHDQRDAFALVASQDGRFTVFAWSPEEEMVHAHRIETLLL